MARYIINSPENAVTNGEVNAIEVRQYLSKWRQYTTTLFHYQHALLNFSILLQLIPLLKGTPEHLSFAHSVKC